MGNKINFTHPDDKSYDGNEQKGYTLDEQGQTKSINMNDYKRGSDLIKAFEIALRTEIGVPGEMDGEIKGLPEFAKELLDYVNSPEYAELIAKERNRILGKYKQLQPK